MDVNSVFFGFLESLEDEHKILANSKKGLQNQSRNYQYQFIEGLVKNNSISSNMVMALPSFGSYLISYKKLIIKSKKWNYDNSAFSSPGFFNLPIIKQISWFLFILLSLNNIKHNGSRPIVHFYSIHPIWYFVSLWLKFHGFKNRVLIIPDLPPYSLSNGNKSSPINSIRTFLLKKMIKSFSSYVVVNDNIADFLNLKESHLIDGFVSEKVLDYNFNLQLKNPRTKRAQKVPIFLYAGNMEIEFGIIDLIDAVLKSKMKFKLYLFGATNNEEILTLIKQTDKIEYFGYKPYDLLTEYYSLADAFIIPRRPELRVNKFSHPSKLYEYMSYLKPILMFELDSISNLDSEMFIFFEMDIDDSIKQGIEFFIENQLDQKYQDIILKKKYGYLVSKTTKNQLDYYLKNLHYENQNLK